MSKLHDTMAKLGKGFFVVEIIEAPYSTTTQLSDQKPGTDSYAP